MMKWQLFLDDERYPVTNDWHIARNFDDAVWMVTTYEIPYHMSLDHDLGAPGNRTGMDFVKWLVDYLIQKELDFPEDFTYYVHSQNPIGSENMRSYLDSFMKNREIF